ncbi:MAG: PfkB family carbohydrate kinase [Anaerolineae bacterium]
MPNPNFLSIGSIFIDDIVYPDGRTDMEILGGGGVHTAAGMAVWGERAGLVASMGTGMPEPARQRIEHDFDTRGLVRLEVPQIRAWQVFEWDGKRTELFRVKDIEPFMDAPRPGEIPDSYQSATAVSVLRDAENFLAWRTIFPEATVFWEPEQMFMEPQNSRAFRSALPQADIVSPNLLEASLVYGFDEVSRLLDAMLDDGAKVVALRLGEMGSWVATPGNRVYVPIVPVDSVIDVTGAGNTYCGGFLVGWQRTHDPRIAGYYGAVAASFALESVGVLMMPTPEERDRRYELLKAMAESSG